MIIKLSKEELHKLIDDNKIIIYFENYWKYPQTGDDQKTCPMLDMMFNIERRGGYVIHIPEIKSEPKKVVFSSADIHPPEPVPIPKNKEHVIPDIYRKNKKDD